ncbi:hypothetical protein [Paenochrobactrum glaciei]|uniref:Uncharacterized protein n=1 Tax=Paenochrobactrum glaciei TaxID=486407 RepID=A0ABN1FEA1_9HYPH
MSSNNVITQLYSKDIAIINAALLQVCTATLIKIDSTEGQALANSAMLQYLTGKFNQKKLVDYLLTSINMADRVQRRAERIAEGNTDNPIQSVLKRHARLRSIRYKNKSISSKSI